MQELHPEEVKNQLEQNNIILLDVREEIEYVEENIDGAKLYPLSTLNTKEIQEKFADKKIVIHCRSGKRSQKAIEQLALAGIDTKNIYNLQGGIEFWKSCGLPVKKSEGKQPISIMRQVQIVVGFCVLSSVLLTVFLHNLYFLILAGFFGAGLLFAGVTGTCALALILAQLPYNKNLVCKVCA